jgi:hypothetical protein
VNMGDDFTPWTALGTAGAEIARLGVPAEIEEDRDEASVDPTPLLALVIAFATQIKTRRTKEDALWPA